MKKFLIVVADIAVVLFVPVFVMELTNAEPAGVAAGVVTGAFVVKGWIRRFWGEPQENEDTSIPQSTQMLLLVGAVALSATAFEAIDNAQDAEWEAEDAAEEVEDLQTRVYELEDELGY